MKCKPYVLLLAAVGIASISVQAAMIMEADDFEHDTIGFLPYKPTVVAPLSPPSGASVEVVNDVANAAGTGNGIHLQDNNASTSVQLQYDFTAIVDTPPTATLDHAARLSAVRVDFLFAPLSTAGGGSAYFKVSLGEDRVDQSGSTASYLDCRLLDDGTIDLLSSTGPDSTGHVLLPADNTLSIFANDHNTSYTYLGPDDASYVLPANTVAYWLNGSRVSFGGQGYTDMENRSTRFGSVSSTTNNIGRFAITSTTTHSGLDYVFDDIMISDLDALQDPTGTSSLVSQGSSGLVYTGYANEGQASALNTVPDFSNVGYRDGGVPIPFVPAAVTLSDDGPGDDTTRIQNAINAVSALSVGPDGFRGAVVLEAGEYTVSSTLTISADGVVIRGAGSQESGGTRITYTATSQTYLFAVSGGSGPSEVGGTRVDITDSYVPVGARSFHVSNASGYAPGDQIMVQNTVNQQWLLDMSDMTQYGWNTSTYSISYRRTVTAVSGNLITIDAPIVQTIEDQYGGGDIYKHTYSGELEHVGFESMRLESVYASDTDENHGRKALDIQNLKNGWVRQVTGRYFYQGLLNINNASRQITVEDCAMLDYKGTTASGNRYSFSIDNSDSILVQRCLTRQGRHDYVSGSQTPGPNVFVDCRATETFNDVGPHHRYSTGQLYDNIMGGEMNVQNRTTSGSGHGWSGAQIMFWNCDATTIICDAPNGAMNWCVGSSALQVESHRSPWEPFGIWDSNNQAVTPRSLYYTQLAERLGVNALNKVILPEQNTGNIWSELFFWDGDGVFGDDVVVWADEETVAEANVPVTIGGMVRKLVMLDRGVTYSWSKVSGPGAVAFGNDTALETTATFTQEGPYVLELSVHDGVSPVSSMLTLQVGEGIPDMDPPAAPTNLAATAGDGVVTLNWDDNSEPDLASYSVYRSTTPGSYGTALATGLTSSEYVDLSVVNGMTYHYAVSAVDINTNESTKSAEVSATPQADTTPPAAPTGLAATAGDNRVSLDWEDNGEVDLASYSVYRSATPGNYGTALASGVTSSEYLDDAVINGSTYYYVVSAVDLSGNESAQSAEDSAAPQASGGGSQTLIVFGSNNDGLGGFTQSTVNGQQSWSVQTDSVKYTNDGSAGGGFENSSLLRAFTLDRSNGNTYTFKGVVHLTDGYADDNNRVGIYLFGDSTEVPDQLEAGAIGLIFNTDDGFAGGAPGDNSKDSLGLRVGIDSTALSVDVPRNESGTVPYAQDLFGTDITLRAEITFTNMGGTDSIQVVGSLTDFNDVTTTVSTTVTAADYTGDWFGFVTRARCRGTDTRTSAWIMDYKSFSVTGGAAPLTGYALWASGWDTEIGGSTYDFDLDGLINWIEYALGGNPGSNDASDILPVWGIGADGGINWLYYTYKRRDDAAARGLTYTVRSGTNLVDGLSNALPAWSVSPATNGFETATHRILIDDETNAFMQLEIELSD